MRMHHDIANVSTVWRTADPGWDLDEILPEIDAQAQAADTTGMSGNWRTIPGCGITDTRFVDQRIARVALAAAISQRSHFTDRRIGIEFPSLEKSSPNWRSILERHIIPRITREEEIGILFVEIVLRANQQQLGIDLVQRPDRGKGQFLFQLIKTGIIEDTGPVDFEIAEVT